MTEIDTCGCSVAAQRTRVYRTKYCKYFHYDIDTSNNGYRIVRHAERVRCSSCGRRYTVSHAGELVHPQSGCPNAPTISLDDRQVPLFWVLTDGLVPRSQRYWCSFRGD